MSEVAKIYQDELPRIKKCVQKSYEYNRPNCEMYNKMRKFVFKTALTNDDIILLKTLQKPQIEFNGLEAFISRLLGEFSKQQPSISTRAAEGAKIDPRVLNFVEGYMRSLMFDANNNSFEYEVYRDILSGGFSAMKVWTEYQNDMSFDQVIRIGRVYDPTLTGFDPLARLSHKGDGRYCFELYPKSREEVESEFPHLDCSKLKYSKTNGSFNWSYKSAKEDIILICDFYEKKKKKAKIVELSNGKKLLKSDYEKYIEEWTTNGHIEQPAAIIKERVSSVQTICRYRIIENEVIEHLETDYKFLPLVFCDGNSILIQDNENSSVQQMTRPYVYNAIGAQKLKNFAGQTLACELENMVMHKWVIAKEAIPVEYQSAYTNNQMPSVVVFNAYQSDGTTALPPPREVQRSPAPPEIVNTLGMTDQMMQVILGSYDASLGINNNQLSGIAIVEGATQSNAAAMPYIVSFLQALNQVAQIIVDLIPKYLVTARTVPTIGIDGKKIYEVINKQDGIYLNYSSNDLEVKVEAGVNFSVQKSRALQEITAMTQASPLFAEFVGEMGLSVVLDNMEIRGIDHLKIMADEWKAQKDAQRKKMEEMPNPMVMDMKLKEADIMLKKEEIALKREELQLKREESQAKHELDAAKLMIGQLKEQNNTLRIIKDSEVANKEALMEHEKHETEKQGQAIELAIKTMDTHHKHTKEYMKLHHEINQSKKEEANHV